MARILKRLAPAIWLAAAVQAQGANTALTLSIQDALPSASVLVRLSGTDLTTGRPVGVWTVRVEGSRRSFPVRAEATTPWLVSVHAPGYWAAPKVVRDGNPLTIALVPTSLLVGQLVAPERLPQPAALTVDFEALDKPEERHGGSFLHELACSIKGTTWQCPMPIGKWNVRLGLPDYAPIYRWAVEVVQKIPTQIGPAVFRPGASISGWVVAPKGTLLTSANVSIAPAWLPQSGEAERNEAPLTRHAVPDSRGFFQVANLAPGDYWLEAEGPGLVSPRVSIQLSPAAERALSEPLELQPPQTIAVAIGPPMDPYDQAWVVEITVPQGLGTGSYVQHSRGAGAPDGTWRSNRRLPAQGLLTVFDSRGSRWISQTVDPSQQGDSPVSIQIPLVRVRGRLTFDGSGVPGRLHFGGTNGTTSIRLDADPEGHFEGALPTPGRWPLQVQLPGGPLVALEDVQVSAGRNGRPARVDVQLPLTRIRGRVTEGGTPAGRALILATREDGKGTLGATGKAFESESDSAGAWELYGIPPGQIRLQAHSKEAESDWVTVDLVEDLEPAEVILELRKKLELRGWLTDGVNGVGGAIIWSSPSVGLGRRFTTGLDGAFSIELPPSASHVDLLIVPPGGGVSLWQFPATAAGHEQRIVVNPSAGALVVPSWEGSLSWAGLTVPLVRMVSALITAGRLETVPAKGFRLNGLAAGLWTWCPGQAQDCLVAEINSASEVELAPNAPEDP